MIEEIQKIKIAITSRCTLRCTHCFINKEKVVDIPENLAIKAIDLLLNSEGTYKRLELYGGEPFTKFQLLKRLTSKSLSMAKKKRKNLQFISRQMVLS